MKNNQSISFGLGDSTLENINANINLSGLEDLVDLIPINAVVPETWDPTKALRPIHYLDRQHLTPTNSLPILVGINETQRGGIQLTLRYPDGIRPHGAYYSMVAAVRTKGVLPIDASNQLQGRCKKSNTCKAKVRIQICIDIQYVKDPSIDREKFRDVRNYQVVSFCDEPHTCDKPVKPHHSDTENFSADFRRNYQNLGAKAFDHTVEAWKSGLGLDFDAAVLGTRDCYRGKAFRDRKKRQECVPNPNSPEEIVIPEKFRTIAYTHIVGQYPETRNQLWYRKTDEVGNLYFMTESDSVTLKELDDNISVDKI